MRAIVYFREEIMFHRILFVVLVALTLTISAAPKLHYPNGSSTALEKAVGYSAGFVIDIPQQKNIIERMTYHGKTMILFEGDSGSFSVYFAGKYPILVDKTLFWKGDKDPQKIAKKYGLILREIMPKYGLYSFTVTGKEDALQIADRIVTNKDGHAFPNLVYRQVVNYVPAYPIADEYYAHQWHLSNDGSYRDYYDDPITTVKHADIRFDEAMDYIVSQPLDVDETTKIAIMDSGVVLDHEDLTEIELGYDAIRDRDGGQPDRSNIASLSQGDIGGLAHGTSCAGLSAAVGNTKGMSGVCPWCGIYPVRYLDPVNNAYVDDEKTLKAFEKYVADPKITAINCSFGPTAEYGTVPVSAGQIEAHELFMKEGRDGKGGVIVYAAGNDNIDAGYSKLMSYLFTFDRDGKSVTNKLVVVSATTAWDTKVVYSNWGESIDLAAPSLSQNPVLGMATTAIPKYGDFNKDYSLMFSGTSASAPVVTGFFGTIFSVNPDLTLEEAVEIAKQSADKINPDTGFYDKDGHSIKFGYGRINLLKAVKLASGAAMCDDTAAEVCDNHIDDNCDGQVDEECRPEMKTGQACVTDTDCLEEGLTAEEVRCVTELRYALAPDGYCIRVTQQQTCADGTKAYLSDSNNESYLCAKECTKSVDCDRDGYKCNSLPLGRCVPSCTKDSDCMTNAECDGDGTCSGVTSPIGGSCASSSDCVVDGYCLPAGPFPSGYCTLQCINNDDDYCPIESICVTRTNGGGGGEVDLCLASCKNDNDCRPDEPDGYICHPQMSGRENICFRKCTDDSYCLDFDATCNDEGRCVLPGWKGFPEETTDEDSDTESSDDDSLTDGETEDGDSAINDTEVEDSDPKTKNSSGCSLLVI